MSLLFEFPSYYRIVLQKIQLLSLIEWTPFRVVRYHWTQNYVLLYIKVLRSTLVNLISFHEKNNHPLQKKNSLTAIYQKQKSCDLKTEKIKIPSIENNVSSI